MRDFVKKIYPLIYGIFGSLGFLCYASAFCIWDYKPSEHPYGYPFCITVGIVSLIVCLVVFCFDIVAFINEERKLRRILIEFLITVGSFFGFIFIWSVLWSGTSEVIRYIIDTIIYKEW